MNRNIEILAKACKKRRLNISKAAVEKLVRYCLLVYYAYRDAYLVDCCLLEPCDAVTLIKDMSSLLELEPERFIVVQLHMDCLIANKSKVQGKLERLRAQDWLCHPLVIDVNGETPLIVTTKHLVDTIASKLEERIESWKVAPDDTLLTLNPTESLLEVVGLPFIAGWLLNYPCLYLSLRPDGINCLSCASLEKYSITLNLVQDQDIAAASVKLAAKVPVSLVPSSVSPGVIDIMEFTVPSSILQHEEFRDRLNKTLECITSYITRTTELYCQKKIESKQLLHLGVGDVEITQTTVKQNCVVL